MSAVSPAAAAASQQAAAEAALCCSSDGPVPRRSRGGTLFCPRQGSRPTHAAIRTRCRSEEGGVER